MILPDPPTAKVGRLHVARKQLPVNAALLLDPLRGTKVTAGDKLTEKCVYLLYLDAISVVNSKRSVQSNGNNRDVQK